MVKYWIALLCVLFSAPAFAQEYNPWASDTRPVITQKHAGSDRQMLASWYGGGERLNRHTSNGERFNPGGMTVAHRSLPFGTQLQISYAGRSVVARVTDRGPAAYTGRSLDVSRGVAERLGFKGRGTAVLTVAVLR